MLIRLKSYDSIVESLIVRSDNASAVFLLDFSLSNMMQADILQIASNVAYKGSFPLWLQVAYMHSILKKSC